MIFNIQYKYIYYILYILYCNIYNIYMYKYIFNIYIILIYIIYIKLGNRIYLYTVNVNLMLTGIELPEMIIY